MAKSAAKKVSNVFVWIILGLLMIALAGFGIGSFGGSATRLGLVGEVEITAQDYARALEQEIRAQIERSRMPVNLADLRARGTDEAVLRSLVARAALEDQARRMRLSVSDEDVAEQITGIEAFQGLDGAFDRQSYEFVLSQQGLSTSEFEETVREDTARAILQAGVVGAVQAPDLFIDAIVAYEGETRDATILTLTEDDLPEPLAEPTEAELQAYYDDNPQRFTRPEARRITYAWVTPEQIVDSVEVDEESLRQLYDARIDSYRQPERRLLERLAFRTEEAAQEAADAIAAGETDFDAILEERELTFEDVDIGEVSREDFDADVAEAIFSDTTSEIIGPVQTSLGPVLFRVNAVLDASEVSFEEARGELRVELADAAARREIDASREEIDDLLASGATLEELPDVTPMTLGQIDFVPGMEEGIAAYDAFREAAEAVEEGDFPELLDLSDGGLFAIRLDEIVPPTLPPLEEIEGEVAEAWRVSALRAALAERAEDLVGQIATGADLDALGEVQTETAIRRQDFLDGLPPTLGPQLFQLDAEGDVVAIPAARAAYVVRLDAINAAARDNPQTAVLSQIVEQAVAQSMAQDIFESYGTALEAEAGITLDRSVINAVHAQFP